MGEGGDDTVWFKLGGQGGLSLVRWPRGLSLECHDGVVTDRPCVKTLRMGGVGSGCLLMALKACIRPSSGMDQTLCLYGLAPGSPQHKGA